MPATNPQLEKAVAALTRMLHPEDLGEPTSQLENKIRRELIEVLKRLAQ